MPYKFIFGHLLDGSIVAVSFGIIGASVAGIELDKATTTIAASGGFLIALGRTALYFANVYKIVMETERRDREEP